MSTLVAPKTAIQLKIEEVKARQAETARRKDENKTLIASAGQHLENSHAAGILAADAKGRADGHFQSAAEKLKFGHGEAILKSLEEKDKQRLQSSI